MGAIFKKFLALVVCINICNAQPVEKLPVLKPSANELNLFRTDNPFVLECIMEGGSSGQQIKYSWHKNGQPFNWQSNPDVTQRKDEGTLVFAKPKIEDEGQYQCFAESDAGVATSRTITVKRTYLNAPKITLQKHKPVEGRPFKLDCAIPEAYPKPVISWVQRLLTDPNVSNPVFDRRILISPDGALLFSNIIREDVSNKFKYVCLATTPSSDVPVPLAEHMMEDLVEDKQKNDGELVPQYLSQDMIAKVGDVTMIYCVYGGTPLAHPDWYQNEKNVNGQPSDRITRHNRSSGRRLLIRDTMFEDQATYTCIANNEVGKPQNHSMKLTVVAAPKYLKQIEQQLVVKEGQDVTIPCQVQGLPLPKLTWTYNAKALAKSDRISILTAGATPTASVADLTIKKVQKSDKGYYGCRATNEYGDIYSETLLHVA